MRVIITINANSDAFVSESDSYELAQILRELANRFQDSPVLVVEQFPIQDHNGNTVGNLSIYD